MISVSVIIPLAPGENLWPRLLADLTSAPDDWEIILAASDKAPDNFQPSPQTSWRRCKKHGRAAQMNDAAKHCNGDFVWFVHADTRLPPDACGKLARALWQKPVALHYFPLRFRDGGARMRANEIGAAIRCALFRNPWGDQALCVPRDLFLKLGGFPEDAPYGEDNLFALRARKAGVPIRKVRARVSTSARNYANGWWRVVARYQYLWIRQAVAEWRK